MLGISGRIKFSRIFILAAMCGQALRAESARHSDYVVFDTVSLECIGRRQQSIGILLDEQSSTRKRTVAAVAITTLAALAGGVAYWHHSNKEESVQTRKPLIDQNKDYREAYFKRLDDHMEEMHSFLGLTKQGFREGVKYGIASAATAAFLSLINKFGGVSWSAIKNTVYPTTTDLCVEQERLFKSQFDYLFGALQDLGREQARLETPDQLSTFRQWRGMIAADVQTSVAVMVRCVEEFSALAIEFMIRMSKPMSEEEKNLVADPFRDLMRKINALIDATNQFSNTLEAVVNIADLKQLDQMRMHVSMHFKHAVFTARDASSQFAALVNVL